jgi:lipase chaperone LimK
MTTKEYREKLWMYWHADLPKSQKELLWIQIQNETRVRNKRFRRNALIAGMIIIALIITYLLV